MQAQTDTSEVEPARHVADRYPLAEHVLHAVHAVALPPALYVPTAQGVQKKPPDRYVPPLHVTGQFVAVVPGPVYAPYVFPFEQDEQVVDVVVSVNCPAGHAVHTIVLPEALQ